MGIRTPCPFSFCILDLGGGLFVDGIEGVLIEEWLFVKLNENMCRSRAFYVHFELGRHE